MVWINKQHFQKATAMIYAITVSVMDGNQKNVMHGMNVTEQRNVQSAMEPNVILLKPNTNPLCQ